MTSPFSYWEKDQLFNSIDLVVVGSGIVGLSAAIEFRTTNPNAKVLVLERGLLPNGASTKNAGFACFGSPSELLDDLEQNSEQEVFDVVAKRWEGLQRLRALLGDHSIDFQNHGGMELFTKENPALHTTCIEAVPYLNEQLKNIVGKTVYTSVDNSFGFEQLSGIIKNNYEGQIDTGKMMAALLAKTRANHISILNNVLVNGIDDGNDGVQLDTSIGALKANKVIVATNGFAKQLLNLEVNPARAQVLITKPLEVPFTGTFHYDKGYYYFRNIHNRVLFGGGRNLDFEGETTSELTTTPLVIDELKRLLKEVILPNTPHQVDYTWAGVMGVGETKKAIVEKISNNVVASVRLGGMGVAIGTLIGKEAAELVN